MISPYLVVISLFFSSNSDTLLIFSSVFLIFTSTSSFSPTTFYPFENYHAQSSFVTIIIEFEVFISILVPNEVFVLCSIVSFEVMCYYCLFHLFSFLLDLYILQYNGFVVDFHFLKLNSKLPYSSAFYLKALILDSLFIMHTALIKRLWDLNSQLVCF